MTEPKDVDRLFVQLSRGPDIANVGKHKKRPMQV